jgi:hypothetical protein
MTFPVPKDVRGTRDFELWLGQEELLRHSLPLANLSLGVVIGEWMKMANSGGTTKAAKLAVGVDIIAAPALGAKVSWTLFSPGDTFAGQSDAVATGQVDLLSGTYQAKTKIYDTGGVYAPGYMLVAIYNATLGGGFLAPLDPGTATVRQLQGVVGKVVEVAGGVLHYESPGL